MSSDVAAADTSTLIDMSAISDKRRTAFALDHIVLFALAAGALSAVIVQYFWSASTACAPCRGCLPVDCQNNQHMVGSNFLARPSMSGSSVASGTEHEYEIPTLDEHGVSDVRADVRAHERATASRVMAAADHAIDVILLRARANSTYAAQVDALMGIRSPLRRFNATDLPSVFGIELIRKTVVPRYMRDFLRAHRVNETFASEQHYLPFLQSFLKERPAYPDREEDLEQLYYIRLSNGIRGHGLFARTDIEPHCVIGRYTGVLSQKLKDGAYAWTTHYVRQTSDGDSDERAWYNTQIDSRARGNAMRFVNDDRDRDKNLMPLMVHENNLWHIFYVTTRHVRADEEFTISYGDAYWKGQW